MRKNQFPALLLTGALSLTVLLSACGDKKTDPTPTLQPSETPAVSESVSPTETPEASETPAQDSPEATGPAATPTQTAKPTAKPTPAPTPAPTPTPKPTPTETPEPTPTETPEQSKVQAVWAAISTREMPSFMDLDDSVLTDLYGIDPADLVEYIGKLPFMNTQATEFFIAQVQSGKMDTVKAALEARQASLEEQWSYYLPSQLELVQNYQLVINGDYIMFAVAECASEAVTEFNTYTK